MGSDVFEPLDATEEESEDKQAGDQQEEGCHLFIWNYGLSDVPWQ